MIRRRDFLLGASALAVGMPALLKAAVSPVGAQEAAPPGSRISRAAIFPAIGFSRVGNSQDWFLAPEVPGLMAEPAGGFKEGPDRIKKQVQRFRVYGYDDGGRVVRELTAADGLEWTVHVANTKAAWYNFSNALDRGAATPGIPGALRNPSVALADRERMLAIDAGAVSIAGASVNRGGSVAEYQLAGRFWDALPVKLGHLRTDEVGRVLVFPGDGVAASALPQNPVRDFTNNDGWHDDWCDGWVKASATLEDGTHVECEPAWVVCCGPDFAPQIQPVVTLYDTIREAMVSLGQMPAPQGPASFRRDVLPVLSRIGMMQWLASAAFLREAWIDLGDLSDPALLRQLADPDESARAGREKVLAAIRRPGGEDVREHAVPLMLGDGVNFPANPASWLTVTPTQYASLAAWAAGEFVDDLDDEQADGFAGLDDLPLSLRPDVLTRAALEACSGGAFHPGVEVTWPIRHAALYRPPSDTPLPFRIAIGARQTLVQDVGLQLNPDNVFSGNAASGAGAPIGPQMPGDLTRWMGVPWHGDAFSCQSVLSAEGFPTPVWWPALLPVDVLPELFYDEMMRPDLSVEERLQFFHARVPWSRGAAGVGLHVEAGYTDGLRRMIALWVRMGIVVRRPGPTDSRAPPGIPEQVYVEVQRGRMDLRGPGQEG